MNKWHTDREDRLTKDSHTKSFPSVTNPAYEGKGYGTKSSEKDYAGNVVRGKADNGFYEGKVQSKTVDYKYGSKYPKFSNPGTSKTTADRSKG